MKKYFTIIDKDIFKQLTEDELLIYSYGTLQTKKNEEFIFSSSILYYYLGVETPKPKKKLKTALNGLVAKGLVSKVADDVYIIQEAKREEGCFYFALYDIEFEALKCNGLLKYFCFILSCLNNKTHEWRMSNSFIQKGYKDLCNTDTVISNKTVIRNNEVLERLNLIKIISNWKESGSRDCNIIKRVNVSEDYKKSLQDKTEKQEAEGVYDGREEGKVATSKESNDGFDKDKLKKDIAWELGLKADEFKLSPEKHIKRIKEVGVDVFMNVIKYNLVSNYTDLLRGEHDAQYKVNVLLKGIFEKDLPRHIEEMKRREEKQNISQWKVDEMNRFEEIESMGNSTTPVANVNKKRDIRNLFDLSDIL